jgi:hypothetical protein
MFVAHTVQVNWFISFPRQLPNEFSQDLIFAVKLQEEHRKSFIFSFPGRFQNKKYGIRNKYSCSEWSVS